MPIPRRWVGVGEAARVAGVSRWTVWRAARAGELGSQYERQAARLVEQIEAAFEEADAHEARVQRRAGQPWLALEGLELAVDQSLEERQRALRLLVDTVELHKAPRKGAGQRRLIPERARIAWVDGIGDAETLEALGSLDEVVRDLDIERLCDDALAAAERLSGLAS